MWRHSGGATSPQQQHSPVIAQGSTTTVQLTRTDNPWTAAAAWSEPHSPFTQNQVHTTCQTSRNVRIQTYIPMPTTLYNMPLLTDTNIRYRKTRFFAFNTRTTQHCVNNNRLPGSTCNCHRPDKNSACNLAESYFSFWDVYPFGLAQHEIIKYTWLTLRKITFIIPLVYRPNSRNCHYSFALTVALVLCQAPYSVNLGPNALASHWILHTNK